jgi:UPF0755 protein
MRVDGQMAVSKTKGEGQGSLGAQRVAQEDRGRAELSCGALKRVCSRFALKLLKSWWVRWLQAPMWLLALVVALAAWWLNAPLALRLPADSTVVDLRVAPGWAAPRVARETVSAGVAEPTWLLLLGLRLSGQAPLVKAGSYEIAPGTTPLQLLDKLVRGEQALRSVTLLEGWTFAQMRQALQNAEQISTDTKAMDAENIMKMIGRAGQFPEGRFFPDTYVYPKHGSDVDVWRQAATAMDKKLAQAWAMRQPDLPLKTPEDVLVLASIVEKETGLDADRAQVAGVFINRLRLGMRLQTDPAVIYGASLAGELEGGVRLRRRHLDADTPYNTYTRVGLPPTPIAMPGWASLQAAVQPAKTTALYFVARGDGSSQFSATLAEHNQAVRRYILKKP